MNPFNMIFSVLLLSSSVALMSQAILVQPHNYLLDDSSILGTNSADSSSLSHYLRDHADKESDSTNFRSSRANGFGPLEEQGNGEAAADIGEPSLSHFSAEMAELIKNEQQHQRASSANGEEPSLSSSVAHVLMNVAQAAAEEAASSAQAAAEEQAREQLAGSGGGDQQQQAQQMSAEAALVSSGSKADHSKTGPLWYNPKETIPVLKISSMATPSKYKKVYFRSEKKLVDGAFHSPGQTDKDESKSFKRAFISSVQRRSSRGTSSSAAPPGILQDGVVEFLRKFRDVYVQTRPTGAAAASSPLAAAFAPISSQAGRPSLMSALGALSSAASKVNSAGALGQAAAAATGGSGLGSPAGSMSSSAGAQLAGAASNVVASVVASPSGSSPSKSPLSAQSYVNFWSKTFPTWVKKMLKQMRRRSLQNHSKRQQNHAHQSHSTLGQAAQAAANVAQAVDQASSGSSSHSANH